MDHNSRLCPEQPRSAGFVFMIGFLSLEVQSGCELAGWHAYFNGICATPHIDVFT